MDRHVAITPCAWCGAGGAGRTCPGCGHDLGCARERCACPACRYRATPLLLHTNAMLRDRTGMIACRLRAYTPASGTGGDEAAARAQPVILCTRLDRADQRDGVLAIGPDAVLAFVARHFTPIGRPDAPTIERFLWIEGRPGRYALLSFAPNRDARGGMAGWREAFGSVLRRIPLTAAEVIVLTSDQHSAG